MNLYMIFWLIKATVDLEIKGEREKKKRGLKLKGKIIIPRGRN